MIRTTVCRNTACPFRDCTKHQANITEDGYYIFENLDLKCERHISSIAEVNADD